MVIQHFFGYIAGMSLGLSITSLLKGFIYSFGRSLTACVATIVCIGFLKWLRSTNSATKEIIDLSLCNSFLNVADKVVSTLGGNGEYSAKSAWDANTVMQPPVFWYT